MLGIVRGIAINVKYSPVIYGALLRGKDS